MRGECDSQNVTAGKEIQTKVELRIIFDRNQNGHQLWHLRVLPSAGIPLLAAHQKYLGQQHVNTHTNKNHNEKKTNRNLVHQQNRKKNRNHRNQVLNRTKKNQELQEYVTIVKILFWKIKNIHHTLPIIFTHNASGNYSDSFSSLFFHRAFFSDDFSLVVLTVAFP